MPVISTNLAANSAVRYLNMNSSEQTASLSKLASGSRITQASDDAAGLAISTKISSDVTALTQAATNASHGVSVLQTADGGASNISDILQRMKSLGSQASSGTVTDTERAYIEAEFSQLIDEVDGISTGTRYNGQSLLDGSSAFADGISIMVGSNASDTVSVQIATLTASSLSLTTSDIVTASGTDAVTAVQGYTTGSVDVNTDASSILATLDSDSSGVDIVISVDGTNYTLAATSGGYASIDAAITALNSGGLTAAGYTASIDGTTGGLVITENAASDGTISVSSVSGYDIVGTTTESEGAAAAAAAAASVTLGSGYTVSSDDVSFNVAGTSVTLTATGGTSGDGVYSVSDLATAIDAALTADSNTTVTVNTTSGELTSASTGASAEVTIDEFDGLEAMDLGLTATSDATTLSVSDQASAITALDAIDAAIDTVSKARASIGALESRFSFRSESIATSIENLEAANSAITDTDVAAESSKLASAKVKTQAAVAAAAQASQMPQDLLKLLQ